MASKAARCLAFALLGLMPIATSSRAEDSRSYDEITPPTTKRELLRNLKRAADQHVVLRADFYTFDAQRKFLGLPASLVSEADGSALAQGPISFTGAECHYEARKVQTSPGVPKPHGSIVLHCRSNGPSFDEIQEVFGSGWKNEPRRPSPHGAKAPEPLTGVPHSYANIGYSPSPSSPDWPVHTFMTVSFGADGSFYSLQLTELSN